MNHVSNTLSSTDISIFSPKICKFCYIKKYRYRLYFDASFLILLTFPESLKIVSINMITILMMSAKMATPSFLKLKVFSSKNYYVIISVHDVTNKVLSVDSNYILDAVMWPTLCGHVSLLIPLPPILNRVKNRRIRKLLKTSNCS